MKRAGVLAMAVLAASLAAALWVWPRPDAAPRPSVETMPLRPVEAFALTVLYVYDGDTIQARASPPNEVVTTTDPVRVRIIGVNTPEGTPAPECWADDARDHLRALLPEGTTVWAAADRDTWDDYGRRLFDLWTDDGRFIAGELVRAGDAEAIRVWPNGARFAPLSTLQHEAQAARRGRWGVCG